MLLKQSRLNWFLKLFYKKIELRILVWTFAIIAFIAYAGCEYYQYHVVGLDFIKWHTHLAPYIYLWLAGVLFFRGYGKPSDKAKNTFLLFNAVIGSFFFVELFLCIGGTNKTQTEKDSGSYRSPYQVYDTSYYHVWPKNKKEHYYVKPEFSFSRPTNSLGFGDVEWQVAKKTNEKRILALGDSFTEGDGAPFDSTYVAFLKRKLYGSDSSIIIMNAGVCGSDPFNNYVVMRDCLLAYQPDIVILSIGTNDMNTDIILRGGMERFQKNGSVKFHEPPWWEPLYAVSYVSRIFFAVAGYNEILIKTELTTEQEELLNDEVIDLFKRYSILCKQNYIRLFVVLRPDKWELINHKYSYDFATVLKQIKESGYAEILDLLPAYKTYLEKHHVKAEEYYWVIDGHHNAKGYEMMAECIFENLPLLDSDSLLFKKRQLP